ncbi:GxxExxY protein [Phenylobacterium sp.]|uniref:GxxExxY protein n=1 Tax=Phenylobacterium sp. TaxID=1871053 RepID=UPI00301B85B7
MSDASYGLHFEDEAFRIRGAAFEVSNVLGHGFLEGVYQECLALEFSRQGIPFRAAPRLRLSYKGIQLQQSYVPDFICFDEIIVELKALSILTPGHRSQVLNYLKATGLKLGLLINFGAGPKTQIERFAL